MGSCGGPACRPPAGWASDGGGRVADQASWSCCNSLGALRHDGLHEQALGQIGAGVLPPDLVPVRHGQGQACGSGTSPTAVLPVAGFLEQAYQEARGVVGIQRRVEPVRSRCGTPSDAPPG